MITFLTFEFGLKNQCEVDFGLFSGTLEKDLKLTS